MYNIILDTNAFVYLMNIEKGIGNTICIEKQNVDDAIFYSLCRKADYLFVTGQTLYELFWQSIEKTGSIEDFAVLYDAIAKYRRIYGINFSILNDADGMFEIDLFQEQYKCNKVDIAYFVEKKRIYEAKKLERLLTTLFYSVTGIILDIYNADINPEYLNKVKMLINSELDSISSAYYSKPGTKNELYDKAIDELLGCVFKTTIDLIRAEALKYGINVPDCNYNNSGSEYIHRLFCQIKKDEKEVFLKYEEYLEEIAETLTKSGDHAESILFLKRLCKRSIFNGAKIRKNDGIDYSIVTSLAKENIMNETSNSIDLEKTFLITFDANLYLFSKDSGVLYKKEIYDDLLK